MTTATELPAQGRIRDAYESCLALVRCHYENFPVASRLMPARLRYPVAVIYAFARTADDLADEGDAPPEERLAALMAYRAKLEHAARGKPGRDPVFVALSDVLARHTLPVDLLHDLLTAFEMDVTKKRFASFDQVLFYCRHSANPVGRLLLHLDGSADDDNLRASDDICTALQLINFWQDLLQDYEENDRIYLPQDEMARLGVTEKHLSLRLSDDAMAGLLAFQYQRTRQMMLRGAPLAKRLRGRFGWEIRLIVQGGLRVLEMLEQQQIDLYSRPRLGARDMAVVAWRALARSG